MYNETDNSINFIVLNDREYKQIPVSLAKVITRDIKPLVFLNNVLVVTQIANGTQSHFVFTDNYNTLAFILRDDKGEFAYILQLLKGKLIYEFGSVCNFKTKHRFTYDNDSLYILDLNEMDITKSGIETIIAKPIHIDKRFIPIVIRDTKFIFPVNHIYKIDNKRKIGVGISVYFKDYSRLFRDIVSSVYTLKDK